jgi:kumamolisin
MGGTHLQTTAAAFRNLESAWAGSGGGCSLFESVLSYQATFTNGTCGAARAVPDIAAIADPSTGLFLAVGSFVAQTGTPGHFFEEIVGGTSLATPATAAILGLVDADRVFQHKPKFTNAQIGGYIYQAAAGATYHGRFFDVTSGSSGFAAGPGWDAATGLGVMLGPAMAAYLCTLP